MKCHLCKMKLSMYKPQLMTIFCCDFCIMGSMKLCELIFIDNKLNEFVLGYKFEDNLYYILQIIVDKFAENKSAHIYLDKGIAEDTIFGLSMVTNQVFESVCKNTNNLNNFMNFDLNNIYDSGLNIINKLLLLKNFL
jgi:hypothetical protein